MDSENGALQLTLTPRFGNFRCVPLPGFYRITASSYLELASLATLMQRTQHQ